jgi:hypothetical protein
MRSSGAVLCLLALLVVLSSGTYDYSFVLDVRIVSTKQMQLVK